MENCFYLQWWDKIDDFINGAQTRFSTAWCGEWWFIICDPEWDEWINALRSHVKGEKFNMKLGWKQQVKGKKLGKMNKKEAAMEMHLSFSFSPWHNFNMLWSKRTLFKSRQMRFKAAFCSLGNNLFLESSGKVNKFLFLIVLCYDGKKIKIMLISAV